MSNREVYQALRTLKKFCYSHETCNSCPFYELTEDMGLICYVEKIIDEDRFFEVVETVPDPTVTISSETIQVMEMPWEEFDDDL